MLKNNYFEHNGKFFKQLKGTAIGTKMAPSYAILFMDELEQKLLDSADEKPLVWWRYIDDVFFIWEHGEEKLKLFLDHLNQAESSIKFTANYSQDSVEFLDVKVIRHGDTLITDLYIKPTDTHQYLHASSCHVYHSKRSIPYSQALRLNRICSEPSFFDLRCGQLKHWLLERGYKEKMVCDQIQRARRNKRNDLLFQERGKKTNPGVKLNITYHPAYSKLKSILSNIHILLTPDDEHRKVFQNIPVVGFKRGKSLKDLLVRAKLPVKIDGNGGSSRCGGKRCGVCPFIKETVSFSDKAGKEYKIRTKNLNCNSECVVYLFTCKTCRMQYVGSATTPFRARFNNYKCCHRKHKAGSIVTQASFHAHFEQADHHGMEDWEVTLIDHAPDLPSVRRRESFWQYKLNSFSPDGLNDRNVPLEDFG